VREREHALLSAMSGRGTRWGKGERGVAGGVFGSPSARNRASSARTRAGCNDPGATSRAYRFPIRCQDASKMRAERRSFVLVAMLLCACGGRVGGQPPPSPGAPDGSPGDSARPTVDAPLTTDAPPRDSGSAAALNACLDAGCDGCCQTDGTCVEGVTVDACGSTGPCRTCAPGDFCSAGTCQHYQTNCGPANCAGCCEILTCAVGNAYNACGASGYGCQDCTMRGTFPGACLTDPDAGGGKCSNPITCSYSNCPGCCEGDVCFQGNEATRCGSGGGTCQACGANAICSFFSTGGTCSPLTPCGAQSCPGCCAQGICATGDQDIACGADGGTCADCTQSQKQCMGTTCQ